jgi:hypothetical protein
MSKLEDVALAAAHALFAWGAKSLFEGDKKKRRLAALKASRELELKLRRQRDARLAAKQQ